MKTSSKYLLIVVSVILLTGLVALFMRPHMGVDWKQPPFVRMRSAIDIGDALGKYQLDHNGHLPSQLSDLVPRYIVPNNTSLFFWPSNKSTTNDSSISDKIDNEGAFVYLGERGFRENLVLYERTRLWPKDHNVTSILTLTTNLTLDYRSVKDVEARILKVEGSVLKSVSQ